MDHSTHIEEIARRYPAERRFSLAILQDIQREFNYIPAEALPIVAARLDTPQAHLYALATFYKSLSLVPKGKHVVKLCDGTACHMRGAGNLLGSLSRQLRLDADGRTDDGQFSVELVNCLGSCALAPVMVVGEAYYGKVSLEQLPTLVDSYREGGENDE
ncbi:MAG: NAD(P)H-dependent oxidoreductase subunit E [Coriobacteriales bacterium]|jgi:NADH-quinone oxidoreductase subunit E|nr:NAD(P)H-dependent oxidoreductase subunit E [Coriobacteriales bacterium]